MSKAFFLLSLGFFVLLMSSRSAFPQGIITLETTPYPINIAAEEISTWQKEGVRVIVAKGNVRILQGKLLITANNATFWFYEQEALTQKEASLEVYCEGKISLVQEHDIQNYEQVFVRLETTSGLIINPFIGGVKILEEEEPTEHYLRAKKIKELGRGEFVSKEPSELLAEPLKEPELVEIVADDIDSWTEENKRIVTAIGNVEIKRETTTILADSVVIWFEQEEVEGKKRQVFKELYAEGNITLRSTEDIIKADKIFQNLTEQKGLYVNPKIKTKIPMQDVPIDVYIGGEEAKQIDKDRWLIKDAYFTTCGFGHPHYRFRSRNVTVTRRPTREGAYTEVVAHHNIFMLGEMPVAYWPRYTYSTKERPGVFKGFSAGSSTRLGTFVNTTWDPLALGIFSSIDRWSNLIVQLDYPSKRGPAGGLDFEYTRSGMEGLLETYYIKDSADHDENVTREPVENDNRGRVLWRHRHKLSEYWRLDAELSYLSDRGFLREFYEKELKEGKDQETDLYLRRLEDNKSLTFLLKKQIHRFDTGPEALPQLSYQWISEPLWEDRLNFTSRSDIGYLDFQIDDELDVRDPDLYTKLQRTTGNSLRMDSVNSLSWPTQLWIWKLKPFIGGSVSGYSKTLEDMGANDGPATGRFAAFLGVDASTSIWRIYSLESKLFRIHKLRHVITPEFRWEAAPTVTEDPDDLLQYGPSDGLDKYNTVILGIRNRFQTRRGPANQLQTVNLLDFDLELHLLPSPEEPEGLVTETVGNAEGFLIPEKDSFLQPDIRAQLTDRLALVSERNEFNLSESRFDVFNAGMRFQNTPQWAYFLGYRFIHDISSSIIFSTDFWLKEKWGVTLTEQYDFRSVNPQGDASSRPLYTRFAFSRRAHDWIGTFYVNFDITNDNTSFKFDLIPVGLKKVTGRKYQSF